MENKIYSHIQKMDINTQPMLQPFLTNPSKDDWVRDVLLSYFNYFLDIEEKDEATSRKNLRTALKHLVPVGARRSLDKMEDSLRNQFRDKGYFFLGGTTGPYYGPYIWSRTEKREFDVELPDRQQRVNVFFMYGFLLRSWMHFQTFGKQGTGGWVKRDNAPWEDGLYCVADAYDIEHLDTDLEFQVSLLKHEAQHFADKVDFPSLSSADLEYRAKLVELIYLPEMKYCFAQIIREASPIKADPHRYASHCILKEISQRVLTRQYEKDENLWASVPYEKIRTIAHELLYEHTRNLQVNPRNKKSIIDSV